MENEKAELPSIESLHLHHNGEAVDSVVLDGANINAKTLDAEIKYLEITGRQDTLSARTEFFGGISSRQVKDKSCEKITNQPLGIHVEDGLNTDGHRFHVEHVKANGDCVMIDGRNVQGPG